MIQLRPYQQAAIDSIRTRTTEGFVLIVSPARVAAHELHRALIAAALEAEPYLDEAELRVSLDERGYEARRATAYDVNEGEDFRPEHDGQ
jgi:hypothetical protein